MEAPEPPQAFEKKSAVTLPSFIQLASRAHLRVCDSVAMKIVEELRMTKLGALNCHNGLTSCQSDISRVHNVFTMAAFKMQWPLAKIPSNRRYPRIGSRLEQSMSSLEQQLSFFTVSAAHVEAKLASPTACPHARVSNATSKNPRQRGKDFGNQNESLLPRKVWYDHSLQQCLGTTASDANQIHLIALQQRSRLPFTHRLSRFGLQNG